MTNLDQRMVFENALSLANNLGYNVEQARCTQSFIRSEAAMSATQTTYQMPLIVNQQQIGGASRVLNNLLSMQDIFVVANLFVGWTVASATATNGKVYSYPSPVAATSAAIATALQTLYNGRLNILNNNINVVPSWDLNRHFFVPRTQQNTNFNVAAPTAPAEYTIDQLNLLEDGFCPVEPNWVINGGGNMVATINLPGAISSIPTNGAIVMIARGILIQNATTVK
jgi:hypothetical protein